ncbi:DUF5615 family PIN-like protein [Mucilaginibacter terrae]|uniref:DUF5615 family PIN-like protein n=1 Tax=Mucilaginibacter terrae TaxID=1955052 RepID=UPI003628D556
MNFLIDVHLPISLSKYLNNQTGCTSIHVNQILQKWHTTDAEISRYADENNMVVISKDSDFKDSHFINKTPEKLIKINLGNISNSDLITLFKSYLYFIMPLNDKASFYIEVSKEQLTIID